MSESAYREALRAGADQLGIPLDDRLLESMAIHHELVVRWAKKINLTTLIDPARAARLHGLDSLLFATLIDSGATAKTVDVGSGGGFPGIVLALARPTLAMTLIEPIRKRASFLRVALAELGRADVQVREEKLEAPERMRPSPAWPADLILSRATIPPLALIALAAPQLRPGGRIITTAGSGALQEEMIAEQAAAVGLDYRGRHRFVLPSGEQRVLDVLASRADPR